LVAAKVLFYANSKISVRAVYPLHTKLSGCHCQDYWLVFVITGIYFAYLDIFIIDDYVNMGRNRRGLGLCKHAFFRYLQNAMV
jgi:hypothetical protein